MHWNIKAVAYLVVIVSGLSGSTSVAQDDLNAAMKFCFVSRYPGTPVERLKSQIEQCRTVLRLDGPRADVWLQMHQLHVLLDEDINASIALLQASELGSSEADQLLVAEKRFENAYIRGIQHQDGIRSPRDEALTYYAIALKDPAETYKSEIALHLEDYGNFRDVLGKPFISREEEKAAIDASYRRLKAAGSTRAVGEFGVTRELLIKREVSFGESLFQLMAGAIIADVANSLAGNGPRSDRQDAISEDIREQDLERLRQEYEDTLFTAAAAAAGALN